MSKTKETQTQAYEKHQKAIAALLDMLKTEFEAHRERRSNDELNWGYVGDLGHARECLKELMMTMSGWTDAEVEEGITNRS